MVLSWMIIVLCAILHREITFSDGLCDMVINERRKILLRYPRLCGLDLDLNKISHYDRLGLTSRA